MFQCEAECGPSSQYLITNQAQTDRRLLRLVERIRRHRFTGIDTEILPSVCLGKYILTQRLGSVSAIGLLCHLEYDLALHVFQSTTIPYYGQECVVFPILQELPL